jgi:integrase/recombinase XerD
MLVQRVVMPTSRVESWSVLGGRCSVLGDDAAPVVPIERYLAYLTDITTCMDAPAARCCNGDHL